MAIKYFCDICGEELTAKNQCCGHGDMQFYSNPDGRCFEVMIFLDGKSTDSDICQSCTIKLIGGINS